MILMSENIYPLNVDVAAQLREEAGELIPALQWSLARLCERAQAAGYQAGYVRGMTDGRHSQRVEHRMVEKSREERRRDSIPDRETLGQKVREVWVAWAEEQPDKKPSWLVPWEGLPEEDREVDRRIGEQLAEIGYRSAL